MRTYQKGARSERELIKYFTEHGFMCMRGAGSGVSGLSPDLLAFKGIRQYVVEAKAHETENLSLDKDQFENLVQWHSVTGIETFVAWRRKKQKLEEGADKSSAESVRKSGVGMEYRWKFIPLAFFNQNPKTYSISWEKAEMYGKDLIELI